MPTNNAGYSKIFVATKMGKPKTSKKSKRKLLNFIKMSSQEEQNQKKIEELEAAKGKLSGLIEKLKENPALSEDEIAEIAGGQSSTTNPDDTNTNCNTVVFC